MKPQLQRLEIQPVLAHDDDFAIEHSSLRKLGLQRFDEFRIVASERLSVPALDEDLLAVAKDQRPEAVPFGLENPPAVARQGVGQLRKHRQDRRVHGKTQVEFLLNAASIAPGRHCFARTER